MVWAAGTGVQVSMLTSRSYLKDSSTYSALSSDVRGQWYPVGGGGEGDFGGDGEGEYGGAGEQDLNLYRSVCGVEEGKENGNFDDFRLDRPGCGGGDGDLDEAGEGVLGRHRPAPVRDRGGGEITRYGFGVLHFLLEMPRGAKLRLKSVRLGDSGSHLVCFLP